MAIVINLKEGNNQKCTCEGSSGWLEHWEMHKGITAVFCRACSTKTDLKGALVLKSEPIDKDIYVVPFCNGCYEKDGELSIWSYDELVPAVCI